jgi:hypothetical protein
MSSRAADTREDRFDRRIDTFRAGATRVADIDQISPWPGTSLARLLRPCTVPVPLLGAGISAEAGLPLGEELAAWIRDHELSAGVDFSLVPQDDPLHVSQLLLDERPAAAGLLRQPLREHFIERCASATLTPALLHLARTPGRLIITLNYDDLIERAAEEQDVPVCSMTRDDIGRLIAARLPRGDDPLHVVHLHGSVRGREQFVLDLDGYRRAMADDDVITLFGTIINQRNFCLLGTSFEEPYLCDVFRRYRAFPPKHVIVCDEHIAELITSSDPRVALGRLEAIVPCSYPSGGRGARRLLRSPRDLRRRGHRNLHKHRAR